ncbi:sugar ABC transporter substrate-binding protein [Ectobacillus funiculus]|uniref:Sugar ABC transporter substrate-binding protein n=1 Tax=Ectobacillus funiculus TaxID=137993 RepID=A0ABV5WJT6_9BACI
MMKKWMVPLVVVVFLTVAIEFTAKFLKGDEKPKVVVVLQELNTDLSKTIKAGIEKGFVDFHIDGKVIAPDSQDSASKQIALLKDVLKQKPDALIIMPIQSPASIPVFKEYQKRNIPVLMLYQDARWKDQTTFIGTDHLRLGKIAGELLSSFLQPGDQVAIIHDTKTNPAVNDRIMGAKETLGNGGIEIVPEQRGDDESRNVKLVISNILQTYPNIKGVFATNDNIALAALKAIEEKELKIPVVGTDGTRGMLKAVEEEKLNVALAQNPYDMGYVSVEQALRAIKGEHVDKRIDSGVDIVTKDNAKSRIDFYTQKVFK